MEFNWQISEYRCAAWTDIEPIALEVDHQRGDGFKWSIARYPGGLIISSDSIGEGLFYPRREDAMQASENYFRKHRDALA